MSSKIFILIVCVLACSGFNWAIAVVPIIGVDWDQVDYYVQEEEEFDVLVQIDTANLPGGLLSMGVEATFDSSYAEVVSISIVAALDNDGTGALGIRESGAGYGRAAGFYTGSGAYMGTDLVTFRLRNLASQGTDYLVNLGLFNDAPTFTNFIDGSSYEDIDNLLDFGSSTVHVIPEPMSIALLGLGGLAFLYRRTRRA